MISPHMIFVVIFRCFVLAAFVTSACGKKAPAPVTGPTPGTKSIQEPQPPPKYLPDVKNGPYASLADFCTAQIKQIRDEASLNKDKLLEDDNELCAEASDESLDETEGLLELKSLDAPYGEVKFVVVQQYECRLGFQYDDGWYVFDIEAECPGEGIDGEIKLEILELAARNVLGSEKPEIVVHHQNTTSAGSEDGSSEVTVEHLTVCGINAESVPECSYDIELRYLWEAWGPEDEEPSDRVLRKAKVEYRGNAIQVIKVEGKVEERKIETTFQ